MKIQHSWAMVDSDSNTTIATIVEVYDTYCCLSLLRDDSEKCCIRTENEHTGTRPGNWWL